MNFVQFPPSIIDSVEIKKLSDSEFRLYFELFFLGCDERSTPEYGNTFNTIEELMWRLRRTSDKDFLSLIDKGFIELERVPSYGDVVNILEFNGVKLLHPQEVE